MPDCQLTLNQPRFNFLGQWLRFCDPRVVKYANTIHLILQVSHDIRELDQGLFAAV